MNTKKFLAGIGIILSLVIVIALIGLAIKTNNSPEQDKISQEDTTPPTIGGGQNTSGQGQKLPETDNDLLKKALTDNDEGICEQIKTEKVRNNCLESIKLANALSMNDTSICEQITDQNTKIYCLDQLILKDVIANKKYKNCPKIQSETLRQQCNAIADEQILLKAAASEDCSQINNQSIKDQCVLHFKTQENLSDKTCNGFTDENLKQKCEDNLLVAEANKNNSVDLCQQIQDSKIRENCLQGIVQNNEITKAKEAAEQGDATSCSAVIDEYLKQKCEDNANYQAMRNNKDVSYCEKIVDQDLRDLCFDEEDKINLYWSLRAQKEQKGEYCQKITNDKLQTECNTLL